MMENNAQTLAEFLPQNLQRGNELATARENADRATRRSIRNKLEDLGVDVERAARIVEANRRKERQSLGLTEDEPKAPVPAQLLAQDPENPESLDVGTKTESEAMESPQTPSGQANPGQKPGEALPESAALSSEPVNTTPAAPAATVASNVPASQPDDNTNSQDPENAVAPTPPAGNVTAASLIEPPSTDSGTGEGNTTNESQTGA